MTDKESSLLHNAKLRDICVSINKYLYFVSGFFNSCLQPSGVKMLLKHLTWSILHQGLQYLFCCHNLVLAQGSSCSQTLVEQKALEAFISVYLSFCLNKLSEKASLDHGWSILGKGKPYNPAVVSVLHCKISVWRERNLLPSTGDSVCWSNFFLSVQCLPCLCHRDN